MGFTRVEADVENISKLVNKPTETPTQLKALFDKGSKDLKIVADGLMDELEKTSAATFIGAGAISEVDESDPNVQAKLESLQTQLSETALGAIPDNSVTKAKLVTEFSNVIAEKDGTEQTNLNSQKLGGKTQAEVIALAQAYTLSDTTTSTTGLVYTSTVEINLPANAKFVLVNFEGGAYVLNNSDYSTTSKNDNLFLIDITNKKILFCIRSESINAMQSFSSNFTASIFGSTTYMLAYIYNISGGKLQVRFEPNYTGNRFTSFELKTRIIEVFGR